MEKATILDTRRVLAFLILIGADEELFRNFDDNLVSKLQVSATTFLNYAVYEDICDTMACIVMRRVTSPESAMKYIDDFINFDLRLNVIDLIKQEMAPINVIIGRRNLLNNLK